MNAQINSSEPQFLTILAGESNSYFAPVLDLDYDEPNAVVEEMDIEFVRAEQFVQTVYLPVASAIVEDAPIPQLASYEIEQRNAA
jgi:hypothetical protein